MFDFLQKNYCVLYADNINTTEHQLRKLIKNVYEDYDKLLIIVDDAHKEQNEIIFPIIDTNSLKNINFLIACREKELNKIGPNIRRTLKNLNYIYLTFTERDAELYVSKAISLFHSIPINMVKEFSKTLYKFSKGDPITFNCFLSSILSGKKISPNQNFEKDLNFIKLDDNSLKNCICLDIHERIEKLQNLKNRGLNLWKAFIFISVLGIFGIPINLKNKNLLDCCEISINHLNHLENIGYIKKDKLDNFVVLHEIRSLEFLNYLFSDLNGDNLISFNNDFNFDFEKILQCLYNNLSDNEIRSILGRCSRLIQQKQAVALSKLISDHYISSFENKKQNSKNQHELAELYCFGIGNYYSNIGQISNAIKYYDEAIRIDPNNSLYLSQKGLALDNSGKHMAALVEYEKGILLNPNDEILWYNKGVALFNMSRFEEAINAYDIAIKLDPTYIDAINNRGRSLFHLGQINEAIKEFDKVLDIDPFFIYALNNKGWCLFLINNSSEALSYIEKSIELNPYNAQSWYIKAEILFQNKKYSEALNSFNKVTTYNPTIPMYWYRKGICLHVLSKYKEAISSYDEAIKIAPNFSEAISDKGNTYISMGEFDNALKEFDKAIDINNKDPIIWYNKAITYYNLHKYSKSLEFAKKASDLAPNYISAWNLQIMCYIAIGEKQKAEYIAKKINDIDHKKSFEMINVEQNSMKLFNL
jgi:tetratricopeptide (TPR) repeat protein